MSAFVETLRRLYIDHKISNVTLKELLEKKKITESDYTYIIG